MIGPAANRLVVASILVSSSIGLDAQASAQHSPALEFEWVWALPRPSLIPASAADVDGDGIAELLLTDGHAWQLLRAGADLDPVATSLPYRDGIQDLALVLPAPGAPDALLLNAGVVRVEDARTAQERRSFPAGTAGAAKLAGGDLAGSGSLQIVACGASGLAVLDYLTGTPVATVPGAECDQLEVGQLDSDAALEIAVGFSSEGTSVLDGATLTEQWHTGADAGYDALAADLDGSGHQELLLAHVSGTLVAWDVASGSELWSVPVPPVGALGSADLVGDGAQEVLVGEYGPGAGGGLRILDGRTGVDVGAFAGIQADWVVAAQLDSDPSPEIAWAGGLRSSADDQLSVTDAATGDVQVVSPLFEGWFHHLSVARLAAGEPPRLLATSEPLDFIAPGAPFAWRARDGALLSVIALPAPFAAEFSRTAFSRPVDVDLDGRDEILVGSEEWGDVDNAVACFDPDTAAIRWLVRLPGTSVAVDATVAEIDSDPMPEILVAVADPASPWQSHRFFAYDGEDGSLKWSSTELDRAPTAARPVGDHAVGDVDGDGAPEIVVLGGATFEETVTILSAVTGEVELPPADLSADQVELAQLDWDPELEIVIASSGGELVVLDPGTGAIETRIAELTWGIRQLAIADWTRDGAPDFAVASHLRIEVLDGVSLLPVWRAPFLGDGLWDIAELLAGDLDLDGRPDLAVASTWGIAVFSERLEPLFSGGFESGDTSGWSSAVP